MAIKSCVICGAEFEARGTALTCGAICRKERHVEKTRLWREANPEVITAYSRQYYEVNQEVRAAYSRQYREANLEKVNERIRLWREANREAVIEYSRQYRKDNPEHRRQHYEANREATAEAGRLWREANPEKRKAMGLRRRARKVNLPDTLTVEQWQHCLDYFDHQCVACDSTENLHADHWIPLSFEGDNPGTVAGNMIPLCQSCNSSKSNANASEWLAGKYPEDRDLILQMVQSYFDSLEMVTA